MPANFTKYVLLHRGVFCNRNVNTLSLNRLNNLGLKLAQETNIVL